MFLLLAFAGAAALYFFSRDTETHNGVVHFTKSGRAEALARLGTVGVATTAAQVPGANLTLTTASAISVSGLDAVRQAEAVGGIVLLSESFTDAPIGALLVVCSPGQEAGIAVPGSGLAVLSVVPG